MNGVPVACRRLPENGPTVCHARAFRLPFEESVFGGHWHQVEVTIDEPHRTTPEMVRQVLESLEEDLSPGFLVCRAPLWIDPATEALEEAGYRFIMGHVMFLKELDEVAHRPMPRSVRRMQQADLPRATGVATRAFRGASRYHADPLLGREACDLLHARWVENSLAGYADVVLVHETDGQVDGFVTVHERDDENRRVGSIGLIGVDPGRQGRGIGKELLAGFEVWCASRSGIGALTIGTIAVNRVAQHLYENAGYRIWRFWGTYRKLLASA